MMEYSEEDFEIICPACGSRENSSCVLGEGWLYTCRNCSQQSIVTDEVFLEAKRAGQKTITGKPLGSSRAATKAQGANPVITDARRRTGKVKTTNPLVENARKRAEKAHTEVQSNV